MVNNMPFAERGRSEVFSAIVDVDEISGAMAGNPFGDFIDACVRFHHSLFE